MYIYIYVCIQCASVESDARGEGAARDLALQDIRLLRGCCARINHPLIPSTPPALTTMVQYYCAIIGQDTILLPTSRLYALQHTILVITISCKGQPATQRGVSCLSSRFASTSVAWVAIDSPCECEHNNPDSLDARLFFTVVLAVAPAVTMDGASSLSVGLYKIFVLF